MPSVIIHAEIHVKIKYFIIFLLGLIRLFGAICEIRDMQQINEHVMSQ